MGLITHERGLPAGLDGKESACNAGDAGSIPRSGRSSGEGNGYPLQSSFPFILTALCSMRDLSCPTWGRTVAPCIGSTES